MPYQHPVGLLHSLLHLLDRFWCANLILAIPWRVGHGSYTLQLIFQPEDGVPARWLATQSPRPSLTRFCILEFGKIPEKGKFSFNTIGTRTNFFRQTGRKLWAFENVSFFVDNHSVRTRCSWGGSCFIYPHVCSYAQENQTWERSRRSRKFKTKEWVIVAHLGYSSLGHRTQNIRTSNKNHFETDSTFSLWKKKL